MVTEQTERRNTIVLNVSEIAYYLYFSIMVFAKGLGLYEGMWPYAVALLMGAFFIILKLALTEHTVAEWLFVLGLSVLGILVWYNSGEKGALIYITMIIAMKNVSLKRLFSIGAVIWGGTFVLMAILTMTGIKSDIFVVHDKLGLGYIIRWSLGHPHPNVLQIFFMMLCAMILYLADWKGRKLVYATLIMLAANLYIFFYSVSYTGIILVVIYLLGNLYLSYRKRLNKLEKMLITLVFPACVTFAVFGPLVLKGKLWEICNKVLNMRFLVTKIYWENHPITMFGSYPAEAVPEGFRNIDSSYVFALMHYGIVVFVLMCVGYMALIRYLLKEQKHKELAICLGMVIAAITEPFFVNTSFKNISLLFMGEFLFEYFRKFAESKPEHFLNKTFVLCPVGKKDIEIPVGKIIQMKEVYVQAALEGKKVIFVGALSIAIIAGMIFAVKADMPEYYYAVHTSTDMEAEEEYLDINNLPEDFNGKILNYRDPETIMYRIEGNSVTVEYVRGIVSSGLWCGLFGALLISGILYMRKKQFKK